MKTILAVLMLLALPLLAGPVTLTWRHPTQMEDGTPIPAELLPDLQATVYAARYGTEDWQPVTTVPATNSMATVEMPVGAWVFMGTAHFPGQMESERSNTAERKVYGRVMSLTGLTVVVVTE